MMVRGEVHGPGIGLGLDFGKVNRDDGVMVRFRVWD